MGSQKQDSCERVTRAYQAFELWFHYEMTLPPSAGISRAHLFCHEIVTSGSTAAFRAFFVNSNAKKFWRKSELKNPALL
jgi:hypothetical protein